MQKLVYSLFTLALLALALPATAQIRTPAASPAAKLVQDVGLNEITVEYSRPSAKGRTIFAADGLVPYGEVWRTGANQATKITFEDAATVGGKKVEAGSYAVLTKPMADKWEIMLFPYESGSWNSYTEKTPAVSFTTPAKSLPYQVETFTIDINNLTMDGATMEMMWDKTGVSFPITTDVNTKVMADIDRVMAGPSANDYYAAASYLHSVGKDLNRALEYVKKANSMGDPRFWMVRTEALIQADLGNKKEAIAAAKRSMELAQKAGNMDYVRMNEKSIKEWNK